jgi:cytochrome c553
MRRSLLNLARAAALAGCTESDKPPAKPAAAVPTAATIAIAGDAKAGKGFAESQCKECHGLNGVSSDSMTPNLAGQDRDYLMMALRAYRDDRRESTTMHKMSLPYGDAVIESIASYYASQPAK